MKTLIAFIAGLMAAPLLLSLAAVFGWLPSNATAAPPSWEMAIGMRALDASLAARAKGLKNPIAPNDKAALTQGRRIYADNCAGCHGTARAPSPWGGSGFYPRAPQFWEDGSDVTPEEAYVAIRDGVRYSGMGAWRDLMKSDDTWKVANFVAQVGKASAATLTVRPAPALQPVKQRL